ncbi:hypothetical protein ABZ630_09125 [Streptomyces albidoflavus]
MYGAWVEGEHPGVLAPQRPSAAKPDGAAPGHELSLWVVLFHEQLAP